MTLSPDAIRCIEMWRLGFVATVSAGGRPNVSPKGTFVVIDPDTVAFGEIRSPQTMTNLTTNPDLEVNFVDQFTRKGVRLRGRAVNVRPGTDEFDRLLPRFHDIWPSLAHRIRTIVKIPVEASAPLSTPPYDDGATEAEMIALYKDKFAGFYPD
ncbi:MAG: pyridoxamine 5'-phosphate oxidase family protein [Pseudomonadota bacterium]